MKEKTTYMSRFRIARNNRTTDRKLFQARIETALVEDVSLLVKWSNRDKNEIVAELLKYALSQESEFQAYKATLHRQSATLATDTAVTSAKRPVSDRRTNQIAAIAN
jgi:hypothetical protein